MCALSVRLATALHEDLNSGGRCQHCCILVINMQFGRVREGMVFVRVVTIPFLGTGGSTNTSVRDNFFQRNLNEIVTLSLSLALLTDQIPEAVMSYIVTQPPK